MDSKAERALRRHDHDFLDWVTDPGRRHDIAELSIEPLDQRGEPRWNIYNDIDVANGAKLTEHQMFLLPQYTLGFALDTKEWSTSVYSPNILSLI